MGWNTGFSLVTDLNKGCSLLFVLKPKVWQGVCSVVRLNTNILIGTSVWGLEGPKTVLEISHFLSYIIGYSKTLDFEIGIAF